MNQLRLNDEYTNVTLVSGDVHIRCHCVVLAVASDYFKAMFRCDLKETTSGHCPADNGTGNNGHYH